MTCPVCGGRRYIISTRCDGRRAVEACDACSTDPYTFTDANAALLARRDGYACAMTYPCYLEE